LAHRSGTIRAPAFLHTLKAPRMFRTTMTIEGFDPDLARSAAPIHR